MSENSGNNLLLLLAVLGVGVGVGVLIAPDKGSITRQKIKDKFDSSSDDVMEKISALLDNFRSNAQEIVPQLKEILKNVEPVEKEDRKSMIELLEKKLEALKSVK